MRPAERSCFVTDSSALVHEVDLSGSWRWAARLPAPASGRPVLVGETLAVPCENMVVGVDTRRRSVRFQAPLSGRISNDPVWAGVILVADETGMVTALDHAGTPRWMLPLQSRVVAPVTLAGDSVLVATTGGPVYRVSAATGVAAWAFPTPAAVVAPPVLAGPGAVVACTDGAVYAIDGATGRSHWGARVGGSVDGAMVVRGATVVAADSGGSVTALSLGDGSQVWRTDIGLVAQAGLSVSGPFLVAWSADGTVVALDGDTGRVMHHHRVGAPVTDLHCTGGVILLTSGPTLQALRLAV